MEGERDDVGPLGELAEIPVGGRAGAAALRGEELDDDRRIIGPDSGRDRRDEGSEEGERGRPEHYAILHFVRRIRKALSFTRG
jgi:hypothetical protein